MSFTLSQKKSEMISIATVSLVIDLKKNEINADKHILAIVYNNLGLEV